MSIVRNQPVIESAKNEWRHEGEATGIRILNTPNVVETIEFITCCLGINIPPFLSMVGSKGPLKSPPIIVSV